MIARITYPILFVITILALTNATPVDDGKKVLLKCCETAKINMFEQAKMVYATKDLMPKMPSSEEMKKNDVATKLAKEAAMCPIKNREKFNEKLVKILGKKRTEVFMKCAVTNAAKAGLSQITGKKD